MSHMPRIILVALVSLLALHGCATESSRTIEVEKVRSAYSPYSGVRLPMSIGKFDNRSSFMRGVFSDGEDRLGSQAKTTLISHLQQSQPAKKPSTKAKSKASKVQPMWSLATSLSLAAKR
jgi:curli biogenesis system outer membrane secretion channel CsgG